MCSLFCASESGCFSYSFEDGICQLGAFHGPPVGSSSNANKTCYVDAKGEIIPLIKIMIYLVSNVNSIQDIQGGPPINGRK